MVGEHLLKDSFPVLAGIISFIKLGLLTSEMGWVVKVICPFIFRKGSRSKELGMVHFQSVALKKGANKLGVEIKKEL